MSYWMERTPRRLGPGRFRAGARGFLALALLALAAAPRLCAAPKARKRVDTWLVYEKEPGFERIRRLSDILTSISVFGDPPAEWVAHCHDLGIEVFLGAGGDASAFDTPEHSAKTIDGYLQACRLKGYDGIDLDFEELDADLQTKYSAFLRQASARLHRAHKKLSHCVALLEGMDAIPPVKIFYDPAVVAETCDIVRVMCYDLYFAPDRGDPKHPGTGFGPTSTYTWAREAMQFWLRFVSRKRLVMGLPAYSNDFPMTVKGGGAQVYAAQPQAATGTAVEKSWLAYERLNSYLYQQADGSIHLFYASDAESTRAQLATVDELGLPAMGFWNFSAVDEDTWKAVRVWLGKP